jgi:hypothetical protein
VFVSRPARKAFFGFFSPVLRKGDRKIEAGILTGGAALVWCVIQGCSLDSKPWPRRNIAKCHRCCRKTAFLFPGNNFVHSLCCNAAMIECWTAPIEKFEFWPRGCYVSNWLIPLLAGSEPRLQEGFRGVGIERANAVGAWEENGFRWPWQPEFLGVEVKSSRSDCIYSGHLWGLATSGR